MSLQQLLWLCVCCFGQTPTKTQAVSYWFLPFLKNFITIALPFASAVAFQSFIQRGEKYGNNKKEIKFEKWSKSNREYCENRVDSVVSLDIIFNSCSLIFVRILGKTKKILKTKTLLGYSSFIVLQKAFLSSNFEGKVDSHKKNESYFNECISPTAWKVRAPSCFSNNSIYFCKHNCLIWKWW